MKTLSDLGCLLIGWNKEILKECGEASHRQYRKLISALCIMMVVTEPWFPMGRTVNLVCQAVILLTTVYSGVVYFAQNKDVFKGE